MNKVFKNSWALFLGMSAIMLAYGYQNALLGVRAVIAESFERIHRSNLIGMGVLPLEFMNNDSGRKYFNFS